MIINHNLSAMYANRQLGVNNSNVDRNMEKLSSGMRINKAGDDVVILGNTANQQVSDRASDYIGVMTVVAQALYNAHGIGIHRPRIYAMFWIGIYDRFFYRLAVRPFLITYEQFFPWKRP